MKNKGYVVAVFWIGVLAGMTLAKTADLLAGLFR